MRALLQKLEKMIETERREIQQHSVSRKNSQKLSCANLKKIDNHCAIMTSNESLTTGDSDLMQLPTRTFTSKQALLENQQRTTSSDEEEKSEAVKIRNTIT